MNLIPKCNGPVSVTGASCRVSLPLIYQGSCPAARLFPMEEGEKAQLFVEQNSALPAEGYALHIEPEKIVLSHADEHGAFYGLQTLFQLIEEGANTLPCGDLEDAPRYGYRGFMLDVCRHFFPVAELKKVLDQMARLKLNTFHWHLSEDQGFRFESKKFPKLNEVSSWRMENGKKYGGYYTQEEIREVVAYAGERQIQVIPEIDLPGHTTAIIAAYPELSCSGEPAEVVCTAGIFPRILCAGNEKVYEFLYELLDEVCALFPAPYFHIGGDEAPKSEWEKCPRCQAEIKEHGLQNEEELQALFTVRLADHLAKNGKAVIGWNEILNSGTMRSDAIAQYWTPQGAEASAREVPKGRKFIFSNVSSFYFDYDHALVTLRATYGYEPSIVPGQEIPAAQVLGLEAPLWTEYVETPERLEEMIFPRMAALAENAWTREKDFEEFKARLHAWEPYWKSQNINAMPPEQADSHGGNSVQRVAGAVEAQLKRWGTDLSGNTGALFEGKDPAELLRGFVEGMISDTYTPEEKEQVVELLVRRLQ